MPEEAMEPSAIRNIVFDLGNVVVRWDPALISARTFGEAEATAELVRSIFADPLWYQLNRGEITEAEAKRAYCDSLKRDPDQLDLLFFHIKDSQALIPGTVDLMERLAKAGFRIFALSDNVREIVLHLRDRYDFWRHFEGVVISAELGLTKPDARIFAHLLQSFALAPEETVFLDDVLGNVEGARAVNMHAIQFVDAERAEADLAALGVRV
jgi:putative hydrolase of the HAD superfamily